MTSPRRRARRTCELAGLGTAAEIEPDLAEWDYGDYEGQRSADIRKERPGWMVFRDGCPGGEMPAQVSDADRVIARLSATGRRRRGLFAWTIQRVLGRALDRTADYRSAAFLARPGVAQRTRLQPRPSRGGGLSRDGTPVPRSLPGGRQTSRWRDRRSGELGVDCLLLELARGSTAIPCAAPGSSSDSSCRVLRTYQG